MRDPERLALDVIDLEQRLVEVRQTTGVVATRPASGSRVWPWAGLAAALAAVAYANGLHGPFVYDDFREVLHNPSIGNLRDLPAILRHYPTRPLTNLSYAVDFANGGLNPFIYHVTNVLLHMTNVVLLFVIARQLAGDVRGTEPAPPAAATFVAFTAASLFAVHPMLTEAVTFISSRAEVLYATFFLCSFLCFRRAFVGGGGRFLIAGSALLLLSLGAKETAVVLPAVLLAYDLLLANRADGGWRRRIARVHAPIFAVVLLIGGVRMWWFLAVEVPAEAGIQWQHLLLQLHVLERYVSMLLLPISQSILPSVSSIQTLPDPRLMTSAGIVGLAVAGAIAARRREPLITFGLAWFGLLLVPSAVLFLIAERAAPMAEHRVYLASFGLFMAIGAAISRPLFASASRPRSAAIVYLCIAAVIGGLTTLTIARNRLWSDPVLLWHDAVQKAPYHPVAHMGLGHTYASLGDHTSAAAAYREAVALRPESVLGYQALVLSLAELNLHGEARQVLRMAVDRMPEETRAMLLLAHVEAGRFNNPAEALRLCRRVLAITPGDQEAATCAARHEQTLKR